MPLDMPLDIVFYQYFILTSTWHNITTMFSLFANCRKFDM